MVVFYTSIRRQGTVEMKKRHQVGMNKNGGLPAVIPSKDGCLEAEFNGVLL